MPTKLSVSGVLLAHSSSPRIASLLLPPPPESAGGINHMFQASWTKKSFPNSLQKYQMMALALITSSVSTV